MGRSDLAQRGTVGGKVVVRQGLVDGTAIGGKLSNSGGPIAGVFPALTVSGTTTVAGDLLADGRGEILFGGGEVAGNAVIGGNGTMTVSGGIIQGDLSCGNFGSITGGTVMKNLNVDVGFITMSGGQIDGNVNVGAGSFSMSNGTVAGSAEVGAGSVVQIGGGSIGRGVTLGENASAFLTGGTVTGEVSAPAGGTVEVNGATVTGNVFLDQAVTASVKSGEVKGDITVRGTSSLDVSGGTVNAIGVGDFATARMSGGEVVKNFVAIENAHVQIVDGVIGGGVAAKGHATVDLFGGNVEGFDTGGAPLGLLATDFGTVNVAGGAQIHSGAEGAQVAELNLNSGKIVGNLKLTGGASAKVGAEFEITNDVIAEDNAAIRIEGGHVGGSVAISDAAAQFTITDGAVDGVTTLLDAGASVSGGTLEFGLQLVGSGHASITGGTVKGRILPWAHPS
jgi:fibronectin-binding autotransporter adhesin